MKALYHAAGEIQNFIRSEKWKFCFIGGIALQRWGEARLTQDIDISLLTGFTDEEIYIKAFLLDKIETLRKKMLNFIKYLKNK
ncbi:hypothetical protein JW948_18950 [bacterium]|nr:hypothetical protein [bacterium]